MATSRPAAHIRKRLRSLGDSDSRHRAGVEPTSGTFGGIVGVYQRHEFSEERRHAMDTWASHVIGLVRGQRTSVLSLQSVRS